MAPDERGVEEAGRLRVALSLAGLTLLALALRLLWLGSEGLWTDEAATWLLTRGNLIDLYRYLAEDVHPPVYYVTVLVWSGFAGAGESALRMVSAVAGVLTVPFLYALARSLPGPAGSRRAGLWAAFFLAVSPFHLHYSQEAKSYGLLLLGCTAGAASLLGAIGGVGRWRRTGRLLLYWLAMTLALLTHPAAWFLMPPLVAAAVLSVRRPGWWRRALWVIAASVPGVPAFPWYWFISSRAVANVEGALAWAEPLFRSQAPWQPLLSWVAFSPGAAPPVRNLIQVWQPLGEAGAAGFLWLGLGSTLTLLLWAQALSAGRRAFAVGATLTLLPLLLLLVVSPFRLVYLVGRTDAVALPFFLAVCGLGAAHLTGSSRGRSAALATVWCALLAPALVFHYGADFRSGERDLFRALEAEAASADYLIVTGEKLPTALYYLHGPGAGDAGAPDTAVLPFPGELGDHPAWEDLSAYDEASLRNQAGYWTGMFLNGRVLLLDRGALPDLVMREQLTATLGPGRVVLESGSTRAIRFGAD